MLMVLDTEQNLSQVKFSVSHAPPVRRWTRRWEEQGQGRWPELAKWIFHSIEHKLEELARRSWSLLRDGLSWEQLCCASLVFLVFYSPFCYLSTNHLHCHCCYCFWYYFISKCSYLNSWLPFSNSPPNPTWSKEEQAAAWDTVSGWG